MSWLLCDGQGFTVNVVVIAQSTYSHRRRTGPISTFVFISPWPLCFFRPVYLVTRLADQSTFVRCSIKIKVLCVTILLYFKVTLDHLIMCILTLCHLCGIIKRQYFYVLKPLHEYRFKATREIFGRLCLSVNINVKGRTHNLRIRYVIGNNTWMSWQQKYRAAYSDFCHKRKLS